MKLIEALSSKSVNVRKTRSIAGRLIKDIFSELDKMGAKSPSDRRRYLSAILKSLDERGHAIINRGFKK